MIVLNVVHTRIDSYMVSWMTITYAVYKVKHRDHLDEPLTAGVAPNLEAIIRIINTYFKGLESVIWVIDEITAEITFRNPEHARYRVIVLKSD